MLQTESRVKDVPSELVNIDVTRPDDPNSTVVANIDTPGYREYFERYTPNSQGSRRKWKTFEHYKCSMSTDPSFREVTVSVDAGDINYSHVGKCTHPYFLYDGFQSFGDPGKLDKGLLPFYAERLDGGFVPPPDGLDSLIRRSLKAMLPRIKSELSLINSIIELKDFASLKHSLASIAKLPFKVRKGFTLKKLAREVLRTASDSYLQAQFNILPLISDITAIHRAVSTYEKRINAFVAREGRVQVKHFTATLNEGNTFLTDQYSKAGYKCSLGNQGVYNVLLENTETREVYPEASVFHAQIQYNYNYTGYQREHARTLALLDSLGINLNPVIIWNAIPWSFVVDWVVGVNQWLGDQRLGNMDPQINILQYLWSVRRRRTIVQRASMRSMVTIFPDGRWYNSNVTRPTIVETAYRRDAGLPGTDSIESSGLSSKEFSLGAALVLSRRKHHKRSYAR